MLSAEAVPVVLLFPSCLRKTTLQQLDDGIAVVEVDTVDAEGSTAPAAPPVD